MKILILVGLMLTLSLPCQAKKSENTDPSRQECINILVKLRELSPKAVLRRDIDRF